MDKPDNEPEKWRFQQHYMRDLVSNLCLYFLLEKIKKNTAPLSRRLFPFILHCGVIRLLQAASFLVFLFISLFFAHTNTSCIIKRNLQMNDAVWCVCNMFCFNNKLDLLFVGIECTMRVVV